MKHSSEESGPWGEESLTRSLNGLRMTSSREIFPDGASSIGFRNGTTGARLAMAKNPAGQ